jgi:heme o synthase
MNNTVAAVLEPTSFVDILADYAELMKLRVNSLVVLTSWCGAYLATGHFSFQTLVHVALGVGSVAAGTAALNEVLERDLDGQMLRTAQRIH